MRPRDGGFNHLGYTLHFYCGSRRVIQIVVNANAMHIAAYYGQSDFVSEMLAYVPASCRSEPPIYNHLVVKELATEVLQLNFDYVT